MWFLLVAAMTMGNAGASAPAVRVSLAPNSYAQERCILSTAETVIFSSRVRKGKSFSAIMKALIYGSQLPGLPIALCRYERVSMDGSTLETFRKIVGVDVWRQCWKDGESRFYFPPVTCPDGLTRQSYIGAFGWKDPGRNLSTEWGLMIWDQAEQFERSHMVFAGTRLNFTEPYLEALAKRLGMNPRQLVLICNADDPEHWINADYQVEEKGMRQDVMPETGATYEVILSQPDDNEENLTDDYRRRRASLKGTVEYERLVLGRWVRGEGLVYGRTFDPAVHIIDRPDDWKRWGGFPPPSWPRIRGFDFGVNHPFVCQWYAERPDGVIVCYRELYGRGRAPSDWAATVLAEEAKELRAMRDCLADEDEARALWPALSEFSLTESWSDHELGWRSELAKAGVWTAPAMKDITAMLLAASAALNERRVYFVRDMLVYEDQGLAADKMPTSVLREFGRYRWPGARPASSEASDKRTDQPVDRDNHGLDCFGYVCRGHFSRAEVWAA